MAEKPNAESWRYTPSTEEEEAAWEDYWWQNSRNERFMLENRTREYWARVNPHDPDDPYLVED